VAWCSPTRREECRDLLWRTNPARKTTKSLSTWPVSGRSFELGTRNRKQQCWSLRHGVIQVKWTQNNSELELRHTRGEGKMEGARGSKPTKSLFEHVYKTENIFPLFISTESVSFWCTNFSTTLYFVNQRNYKTLAVQTHALTRTRYIYNLNVIISHPIVQGRTGLSLSVCYRFAVFPSLPRVFISHPSSELFCVHYIAVSTTYAKTCPTAQIRDGKPLALTQVSTSSTDYRFCRY
jgi:hypothetical protein